MFKQLSSLKHSFLRFISHRITRFSIVILLSFSLCLSSKVTIAQQKSGNLVLPYLEIPVIEHLSPVPLDFPTAASTVVATKQLSIPTESNDKPEPKVLISEVVITGVEGELQQKILNIIQTKSGGISTHSLLEKDINAIFLTGYFSNVKAIPENTPSGVRVTFKIKLNPTLKLVNTNSRILPKKIIKEAFQSQYGNTLNLINLQEGIKALKKWYQDNGYVLVQFVEAPKISDDGTVTLEVAEGIIEDIQVQFVKIISGLSFNTQNGKIIQGKTPKLLIVHDFRLKRGEVFNINKAIKDIKRIKKSRGFNDIKISWNLGLDPKKVIVQVNVEEKEPLSKLNENLQGISRQYVSQEAPISSVEEVVKANQEIIKISQPKKDVKMEIEAFYRLGSVYKRVGEYSNSIDAYNRALSIVRSKDNSINASADKTKNLQDCDIFTQGKETMQACGQNQLTPQEKYLFEINILLELGDTYRFLGDYQQALDLNQQSFSLINSVESNGKSNENKENIILLKIVSILFKSSTYSDLGEKEIARDYINQAQRILTDLFKDLTDKNFGSDEGFDSNTMLKIFVSFIPSIFDQDINQPMVAFLDQYVHIIKETKIDKETQPDRSKLFQKLENTFFDQFLGLSFYSLGEKYNDLGEKQKALEIYQQALQKLQYLNISEINPESEEQASDVNKIKDMLTTLARSAKALVFKAIGDILADSNKNQEALIAYQQALNLLQIEGEASSKASALYSIGKVYHSLFQYQQALDSYNQALIIWSGLGNQLEEANTHLGIAHVKRDLNQLYAAKNQIETAIQLIEQEPSPNASTSSLSSTDEQRKFKYYISLASYFSAKQNFYDFYVDLLMQLHKQFPSHGYMVQAFQANEQSKNRSLLAILNRRDRYVSKAKAPNFSDARYVNLGVTPRLSTIQQQILDGDSILLEYALGEERSYLWVVSKTRISSYELPKRTEIETLVRQFYDFMTVPSLAVRTNKAAKVGNDLSQMLLGQVANQLDNKRLIVVADGALQYIPFGALPDFNSVSSKPLLAEHEIVMLPSASIFSILRNNVSKESLSFKTLAVVTDPVFGSEDERAKEKLAELSNQTSQRSLPGNYQANSSFAEQLFPRLPNTQNEADQIGSLVTPKSQVQYSGFSANRRDILALELNQYRLIHIATHGILDAEKPERSGMLLSAINDRGSIQRSLLSAPDVFNLQLSSELVVLSGCRTGLGKQIRGEGLMGLAGGLMYSGAKRVVVSLWSVDDDATVALMNQFYQGILKENLSPSKALRKAQLEVLKQPHWQNPYYWAPFILQGEWK
ncbi:MAG: CHAT domain-containing protein [Tildeniella nuda ZEHNDER 1965/U140]|jgi:CHAT domain-containing protein|nr:CHAT domain-containing protein [Tildeniella nuda ZEHNDER 1965/U140]